MSDPLANAYNLLGAQGMVGPNPYLEFTGQIPMAGYAGTPTNAQGQPIQSYQNWLASQGQAPAAAPGTTLNSGPTSPAGGLFSMMNQNSVMNPGGNPYSGYDNWSAFLPPGAGAGVPASTAAMQAGQTQQAAPTPAPTTASGGLSQRQAYLQAMANPGALPTYGAVMQPGARATGAPQPSVLAQFLAAHPQGGTTGAGGYTNAPFFSTLKNLQQAGAT